MPQRWLWLNTTQLAFGEGVVKEHLAKFVKPGSKVICTFGGGSIDKNGARADTQAALDALGCWVKWEGGILANPEYERLIEIVAVVKRSQPDLLLAVGGGSVFDGTKFISVAAKLPDGVDAWQTIIVEQKYPDSKFDMGGVLTLPATGSEWNSNFVVSRRAVQGKTGRGCPLTFPVFSLIDPKYTLTLPARQLANGVFDAMIHCVDQCITGEPNPLMDSFFFAVMKELVTIGVEVVKPGSSLELHERLIVAASFALNFAFTLGKDTCWAIHQIGHELTAEYNIDHGATLAIAGPEFLAGRIEERKVCLARAGEYVFGIQGTPEEQAAGFVRELKKFAGDLGLPLKVSDWSGAEIKPGDVEKIASRVLQWQENKPYGWNKAVTREYTVEVLSKIVV